jgi:BA14K-like protein
MEPTTMINLKVLSTVAVMALVLPMMVPSESFAAPPGKGGPGVRSGGTARSAGAPRMSAGPRFNGGGSPGRQFSGNPGGGGGGGNWHGGNGYRRGGGGGFIPGAVAGAVIGGAIASQSYGYAPGYDDQGYYADQQYYDDGGGAVAVAPAGGDDSVAYCMQTYRSYDPQSGTYMGFDGYRHPCP